ncbi:AI-2E family transporter [Gammaproteobacteria bacterium]|nr:AI-2E family transporter [Gammaproteobacteria bacterium]
MKNLLEKFMARFFSNEESIFFGLLLLLSSIFILLFGDILLPVFISIVIAFLLNGLLKSFESLKISSTISLILTLVIFFGFYLSIFITLPSLGSQINSLLQNLPTIVVAFQETLGELAVTYGDVFSEEDINSLFLNFSDQVNNLLSQALGQLAGTISFMFSAVLYAILIPIMVFFFLKDKTILLPMLTGFLPKKRGFMNSVFFEMNGQLYNYVTGKVIEMIIVALCSYVVFSLFGLPYAVLMAILVGLSVVIPFFGAILVTIPVAFLGLYEWGLNSQFLWFMSSYLLIQVLDGNVLVPFLFSTRNNLHPVVIIITILFFGGIWGFWGLFFAIPLATFIKAIVNSWPEPKKINSTVND